MAATPEPGQRRHDAISAAGNSRLLHLPWGARPGPARRSRPMRGRIRRRLLVARKASPHPCSASGPALLLLCFHAPMEQGKGRERGSVARLQSRGRGWRDGASSCFPSAGSGAGRRCAIGVGVAPVASPPACLHPARAVAAVLDRRPPKIPRPGVAVVRSRPAVRALRKHECERVCALAGGSRSQAPWAELTRWGREAAAVEKGRERGGGESDRWSL
jgi:hypothetical protein